MLHENFRHTRRDKAAGCVATSRFIAIGFLSNTPSTIPLMKSAPF
ncbi:hypothetical protein [Carnobacterium sp.]